MSDSDREFEAARDHLERLLRRRMVERGHPDHADCAFARVVLHGSGPVEVECEHGDPFAMPQVAVW